MNLLRWFAVNGGRSVAVLAAIVSARREGSAAAAPVLDFLERHVGPPPPVRELLGD